MKEVDPLSGWSDDGGAFVTDGDRENTGEYEKVLEEYRQILHAKSVPSESDKIIITLLMRLYDVQQATLSAIEDLIRTQGVEPQMRADPMWDTHNEGGHFNPEIYVPDYSVKDEDD